MAKIRLDPVLGFELLGLKIDEAIKDAHELTQSFGAPVPVVHAHLQRAAMHSLNGLQSARALVDRGLAPAAVAAADESDE